MPTLVINSTKELPITSFNALIGRWAPDSKINLDIDLTSEDPGRSVSRQHARIAMEPGGGWVIVPEPDAAETAIGRRVIGVGQRVALHNGDRLRFGSVAAEFRDGPIDPPENLGWNRAWLKLPTRSFEIKVAGFRRVLIGR